jgi:V/A-type H+/Na+-transporting ATPase subunit I
MKPIPMQRVTLHMLVEHTPAGALALAEGAVFAPEHWSNQALPARPAERYGSLVKSIRTRLEKILGQGNAAIPPSMEPFRIVPEEELVRLDDWSTALWLQHSEWIEGLRRLEGEEKTVDRLMMTLVALLDLKIDLQRFHQPQRFMDLRIGTVPSGNIRRLTEALGLAGYTLSRFLESEHTVHLIVAGPLDRESDIVDVLQAAGWQPLSIPPELSGYPEKTRLDLMQRRQQINEEQRALQEKIAQSRRNHRSELREAALTLAMATPYAELSEVLKSRGGLAVVTGWVPECETQKLDAHLRRRIGAPLVVTAREPLPGEVPPSTMHHHRFLQPFVALVKNYGIPRYGEFDPTLFFAFTYIAMFGMMYGDVGHGAVIAVAGLAFRRRLQKFAPFLTAAGLASMVFGFLYGSIFGFEEWLQPLWIAPLSDPTRMLMVALYWGIAFILLTTAFTVYNRINEKHMLEALCDGKGVAGILLYLGLLYSGWQWLGTGHFGVLEGFAMGLPFAVVIAYRWWINRLPLAERLLVVAIESFETIMTYLSGTFSFLRVAAFSLNHVALAVAVLALAEMMNTAGHWTTVVIGNIFSLVLEGGIVAIQVLRLEYYEGFSRFFQGDGRQYRPLVLSPDHEP